MNQIKQSNQKIRQMDSSNKMVQKIKNKINKIFQNRKIKANNNKKRNNNRSHNNNKMNKTLLQS